MVKLIHLPDRFHTVATSWLAALQNPDQLKSISVFFLESTCPKAKFYPENFIPEKLTERRDNI